MARSRAKRSIIEREKSFPPAPSNTPTNANVISDLSDLVETLEELNAFSSSDEEGSLTNSDAYEADDDSDDALGFLIVDKVTKTALPSSKLARAIGLLFQEAAADEKDNATREAVKAARATDFKM